MQALQRSQVAQAALEAEMFRSRRKVVRSLFISERRPRISDRVGHAVLDPRKLVRSTGWIASSSRRPPRRYCIPRGYHTCLSDPADPADLVSRSPLRPARVRSWSEPQGTANCPPNDWWSCGSVCSTAVMTRPTSSTPSRGRCCARATSVARVRRGPSPTPDSCSTRFLVVDDSATMRRIIVNPLRWYASAASATSARCARRASGGRRAARPRPRRRAVAGGGTASPVPPCAHRPARVLPA